MREIGIGVVGGGYMGKAHSVALSAVGAVFATELRPRLVYDRDAGTLTPTATSSRTSTPTASASTRRLDESSPWPTNCGS